MSLRSVAVAAAAALVALAVSHGLAAETLKIASPIRGSWEGRTLGNLASTAARSLTTRR